MVERAARHSSLLVGAYHQGLQVSYLRVVSDRTTFAWICDVWVDEAHRRRGIARAMVRFALAHPEHQRLRRWLLATTNAHGVYQAVGFEPLAEPHKWMTYRPPSAGRIPQGDCEWREVSPDADPNRA